MNKLRRRQIAAAMDLLSEAMSILEHVRDEEQESFDNMPESLQGSERGEAMEEIIYNLEEYRDSLSEIIDGLEEI